MPEMYIPPAHRQVRPLRDMPVIRDQIERHIETLLELEARTHPARARDTPKTKSKDADSHVAIMCVEALLDLVLGWAWDHRIGVVINEFDSLPRPEGNDAAKWATEGDRYEAEGGAYRISLGGRGTRGPGRSDLNRRILAELTGSYAPIPPEFERELSSSLHALDMGEVQPLLQRTKLKGSRAPSYSLWQARLGAIAHVYFFWGHGETKSAAIAKVAAALGAEAGTVEKWEKSGLAKHFGKSKVAEWKASARAAGVIVRKKHLLPSGTQYDDELIKLYLAGYGADALKLTVRDYKSAAAKKNTD